MLALRTVHNIIRNEIKQSRLKFTGAYKWRLLKNLACFVPGARGAYDAEQEVLRRNRARSVLKEQKDPGRACAAALHSHHESERQA